MTDGVIDKPAVDGLDRETYVAMFDRQMYLVPADMARDLRDQKQVIDNCDVESVRQREWAEFRQSESQLLVAGTSTGLVALASDEGQQRRNQGDQFQSTFQGPTTQTVPPVADATVLDAAVEAASAVLPREDVAPTIATPTTEAIVAAVTPPAIPSHSVDLPTPDAAWQTRDAVQQAYRDRPSVAPPAPRPTLREQWTHTTTHAKEFWRYARFERQPTRVSHGLLADLRQMNYHFGQMLTKADGSAQAFVYQPPPDPLIRDVYVKDRYGRDQHYRATPEASKAIRRVPGPREQDAAIKEHLSNGTMRLVEPPAVDPQRRVPSLPVKAQGAQQETGEQQTRAILPATARQLPQHVEVLTPAHVGRVVAMPTERDGKQAFDLATVMSAQTVSVDGRRGVYYTFEGVHGEWRTGGVQTAVRNEVGAVRVLPTTLTAGDVDRLQGRAPAVAVASPRAEHTAEQSRGPTKTKGQEKGKTQQHAQSVGV